MYPYVKDVLDVYQLDDEAKARKRDQGKRLRRGSAGVLYVNPTHFLDAVNYDKEAWGSVPRESIKQALKKAERMSKELDFEDECNDRDMDADVKNPFKTLNLTIEPSELHDFVHVGDENNKTFAAVVLEDVGNLLEKK